MPTIAVIIDKDFEDSEYEKPVKAFQEAGHKIIHLGVEKGARIVGKRKRAEIIIDESAKNADPNQYDALLIPGGKSPANLRQHEPAVLFIQKYAALNKPIFSICHGPQLLAKADVIRGKKITGFWSIYFEILLAGAKFINQKVVVDDNFVSSRHPGDLPDFIKASLEKLKS